MDRQCDYTVIATFRFKPGQSQKFRDFLDGENGISITRWWAGCKLVEIYESAEDADTLIIWEKWETKEDHESYIKMRTDTGAFERAGEWLKSPPEIVSLKLTPL